MQQEFDYKSPENKSHQEIWQGIEDRILNDVEIQKSTTPSRFIQPFVRISAALAILSISLLAIHFATSKTIATAPGKQITETLPDGSSVQINSGSKLTYRNVGWTKQRNVKLSGEAYFKITKNVNAPFVVRSSSGKIAVLGTEFNVYDRLDSYQVHCFEGRVSVDLKGQTAPIKLTQFEGIELSRTIGKQAQKETFNPALKASWLKNEFHFKNKPVEHVFEIFERQFAVHIQGDYTKNALFSGSISIQSLETAIETVCVAMGFDFQLSEKTIEINRRK